jgi:sugar-phosphatase
LSLRAGAEAPVFLCTTLRWVPYAEADSKRLERFSPDLRPGLFHFVAARLALRAPSAFSMRQLLPRRETSRERGNLKQMERIRCKAVLFDLDGVLVDSTPAVTRVWEQWAHEHGFDPGEVVHRAHGRPSIETLREYLPDADYEKENAEVERREIADLGGVVPLPGALNLLSTLPPGRWTIATSCTRPLAEVRIRAGGLPVPSKIITASEITKGKPDPEPYLKAAALLGVPASECVVFEDVPAGIRAGKAAGATVLALRTTVREEELRSAGADFVLNSAADIAVESYSNDGIVLTFEEEHS